MPFDASGFQAAPYQPRTADVEVAVLAAFFPEGESPVFKVRGLYANEILKADQAANRRKKASALTDALTTGNQAEQMKEVQKLLGYTSDPEPELSKRIEMLIRGSVVPAIDRPTAVKLSETFPIEFFTLTNMITDLTGKGQEAVKKPKPSGVTKT